MAEILTATVEFKGNGDSVPGYLARPAGEAVSQAVVVIQEWWGLDGHIRQVTERWAQAGFVALAPDLYRGVVAAEPDEARKLAMELDREKAIVDIQGAVDYLLAQDFVAPKKVGVVGFCMGGGLALWMASAGRNVGASVVFYGGRGWLDDESAQQIQCPVLGLYGELDAGLPLDMVRANEQKLKEHGKIAEFVIYPQAPHAFFNDTRPAYRPDAADNAWERATDWFGRYLK